MMRYALICAVALAGVIVAGCGVTARADRRSLEPDPERSTGAAIYAYHCAGCHGSRGISNVDGVPGLAGYGDAPEAFSRALTDGPGIMPMFPSLDADARLRLHAFVVDELRPE